MNYLQHFGSPVDTDLPPGITGVDLLEILNTASPHDKSTPSAIIADWELPDIASTNQAKPTAKLMKMHEQMGKSWLAFQDVRSEWLHLIRDVDKPEVGLCKRARRRLYLRSEVGARTLRKLASQLGLEEVTVDAYFHAVLDERTNQSYLLAYINDEMTKHPPHPGAAQSYESLDDNGHRVCALMPGTVHVKPQPTITPESLFSDNTILLDTILLALSPDMQQYVPKTVALAQAKRPQKIGPVQIPVIAHSMHADLLKTPAAQRMKKAGVL